MCRSVAGQIEYWVTLGRVVEHQGLSVQESREAIEMYEAAARKAQQEQMVADLTNRLIAAQTSGSLARHVRTFVEESRAQARDLQANQSGDAVA